MHAYRQAAALSADGRSHNGEDLCAVESYSPDPAWRTSPRTISLNPPVPSQQLPPLIHHIKIGSHPTTLRSLLCDVLGLHDGLCEELIAFGAVYMARPLVPGEKGVKTGRASQAGAGPVKMSKAMRVVSETAVPAYAYVRVHENPKRHLSVRRVQWSDRIIYHDSAIVAVDKPPGVPTTPTVDNLHECALSQVSAVLGQPVLTTNRIDLATSGLVVFGLSAAASREINAAFSDRRVTKLYKAVVWGKVDRGLVRHGFRKPRANAKPSLLRAWDAQLEADASAEWQPAVCEVLDCQPMPLDTVWAGADASLALGNETTAAARGKRPHEVTVKLLTGRTHQIRLQMAALGAPLVGDSRYMPVAGLLHDDNADAPPQAHHGDLVERVPFGPEPEAICLQAFRLEFAPVLAHNGGHADNLANLSVLRFEAGTPWWRSPSTAAKALHPLLHNHADPARACD